MYRLQQRVRLVGFIPRERAANDPNLPKPMTYGKVVGMGAVVNETSNSITSVYIVELDIGFYDPIGTTFIRRIVVHEDNMKETNAHGI